MKRLYPAYTVPDEARKASMEMRRRVRGYRGFFAFITGFAAMNADPASAQPQANAANAALSVNGTGRVDQGGTALFMNSRVFPTPPGSAPLYHHATTPSTSLEFRIQGPVGAPIALAVGALNPTPTPIAGYWFELTFQSYQLLVNAADPSNLVNLGAFIGAGGAWTFVLPQGVPPAFGTAHLQGLLIDPAAPPPLFVRFTGTVTLGVQNDIPALARNVADAYTQADDNPLYLLSLCSAGFKWGGATAGAFLGQAAAEVASGAPNATTTIVYNGIGPNTTIGSTPPTGPPTMG
jgi:hypothetical protein